MYMYPPPLPITYVYVSSSPAYNAPQLLNVLATTHAKKVGEASDYLDVNHCWGGTPSIVDYMPLDGVYHYELGSIGLLDRTHVHCSSNWRKYGQGDHKDIILLHIG